MYRIDLETGACKLDTQNPGDVIGWTPDNDFVLRAAGALDPTDGKLTVRVRDTAASAWRDLMSIPFAETPILGQLNGGSLVAGFTPDGKGLYMVSWRGSDTTRLVRVDAATGRELETLAHDPRSDLWGNWDADRVLRYRVMFQPQTGVLQAVAFQEMKVEWKAIDPGLEKDFAALRAATAPAQFFVNSRDRADRTWIVATARPDGPTSYFLYDRAAQHLQHLFDDFPELRQLTLAPVEPRRIQARDGLSLPCYLTLPPGVPARGLPLVLNVHGGPWARDGWFYEPIVQWLANRGYAVLQVEFRGTMGFGKKFLNAGDRQWGGTMQHDLTDAVQWAVKEGIADPKRVAIMGGSYGGYATLAGLAFTPELYACGVDIVGPSDVATTLASFPPWWAPVKRRWILRVGDVETDAAFNKRISPLYHADKIRAPLLIGHGANDPRVKLEQSEQIAAALRQHGVPVTLVVYPDEGHGFGRSENNLDFCGRTEEFLAKYLGGRAEPWVAVEGSSASVRVGQ
jgi:dipeptidyl aminopeptidase/acylaminoacyl peptidase